MQQRTDGLIVSADSMFLSYRAKLADLAKQHSLPAMPSVR